jgi:ribosomal protein S6--L-glutamate ligase
MNIVVLSTNNGLYSTQRLIEAGERRGHDMRVVNHMRCYMNIASNHPEIHYKGQVLQRPDAIIPRIGASVSFYGTAVVR